MTKLEWSDLKPRINVLRHIWKPNERRSGIDEEVLEKILGHAGRRKNVAQRYGFVDDYELVKAIDKFT